MYNNVDDLVLARVYTSKTERLERTVRKQILLVSALAALVGTAPAVVVVDGVAGGDGDGVSPFETAQAAVKYAIANSDPVVEIHTNTPAGAVSIVPSQDLLTGPLTIRAGAGFNPTFSSAFTINPANPEHLVTLENITIELPPGTAGGALMAAGQLALTGCEIRADHQGGVFPVGIKCNIRSPESTGTLTITDSYVSGLNGIIAGHSIKDYIITSSTVIGLTGPGLPWSNSSPVANLMNWETNEGGVLTNLIDSNTTIPVAIDSAGTTAVRTLAAISEPRTLTLNQTLCRSDGPQLAWPPNSLEGEGTPWYGAQNDNTIGPITATNCTFDGCNPVTIGSRYLTANQAESSTFTNCTFRTSYGVTGSVMLQSNGSVAHTFYNNLFDSPLGIYGIGVMASTQANITLAGDGNIYSVLPGAEVALLADGVAPGSVGTLPPFEATYTYAGRTADGAYVSRPDGSIVLPYGKNLVANKAIAVTPAVTVDMFGNPRPLPSGTSGDVGVHEFDETINRTEGVAYDSSAPTTTYPFTNPLEAVDYAIANSLDTVEITVDDPTGGFSITPAGDYLHKPLSIKAAFGANVVFTYPLTINPANPAVQITMENINVALPADSNGAAVYAAGNLVMNNCKIEANDVGGGHYPVGIACNLRSPSSLGTLRLNNCLVTGHNAIIAGHSMKDYILNDTKVVGLTSDLAWNLTGTIVHLMNWETNAGGGLTNLIDHNISINVKNASGGTDNVALAAISEPRTLNMNRSILSSNGQLLAWPPDTLEFDGNYYYGASNDNTIGPVTATNCLFDGCNPVLIGNPWLWDAQDYDSSFTHCTFRTTFGVTGAVRLHSIDPATYTFTNCLFDSPQGIYGIGVNADATGVVLAGDGNVYYIKPDVERVMLTSNPLAVGAPLPPFEATTQSFEPLGDPIPFLTGTDGLILDSLGKQVAGGKAVAMTPPLLVDLYDTPRPQPASATANDVGAVEFDETSTSMVRDWTLY